MVKKRVLFITILMIIALLAGILFMVLAIKPLALPKTEKKEESYKGARLVMEYMEDSIWQTKGRIT